MQPPRDGQALLNKSAASSSSSTSTHGASTDKRRMSGPGNYAPSEPVCRGRDRDRDSVSGASVSECDDEDSYSSVSLKHK
jgi:hypothetical protein